MPASLQDHPSSRFPVESTEAYITTALEFKFLWSILLLHSLTDVNLKRPPQQTSFGQISVSDSVSQGI